MSASDKKKLRKEQNAAVLSEKQRHAQSEAKKLKIQTIAFVVAMVLVVCVALGYLGYRFITKSGIIEKNTHAATIGSHELNSVELSYYYVDAINSMYEQAYSQYSFNLDQYFNAMGLNITEPLNSQECYLIEKGTWADYFVNTAINNAKSDYALYDMAVADGFKLPSDAKATMTASLNSLKEQAKSFGYKSADDFLQLVMYGPGSNLESYTKYLERSTIANAYYQDRYDSLTYDDAALREHESKNFDKYSCFSYHYVQLNYTDFQTGGVKGEDGKYTYTDEQTAAAREALEAAAEKLATAKTVEELKEMIKEIKLGDQGQLAVNEEKELVYSSLSSRSSALTDWMVSKDRTPGEVGKIAITATAKEGEDPITNGYYIVVYGSRNDNTDLMNNVRHLLVQFEGGTTDETTGEVTYSEEEKNAAKIKAEGYLKTWQDGAATEDTFIELVKEYSDDSSASYGGLFEDVHIKSNYVDAFRNWATNTNRKVGDAEVIETEFGFHVMYYVGKSESSYRDSMITDELRTAAMNEWYEGALKKVTTEKKNVSRLNLDMVIASGLA